jgi:hypothetical protein
MYLPSVLVSGGDFLAVSNYVEDKQMWNSMQGVISPPFSSNGNKDTKKLRKSPPLTNAEGKCT